MDENGSFLVIPAEYRSWGGITGIVAALWQADSVRGRLARGTVWSLVGTLLSQGSNLAASVITARMLGQEQFGELGIVQSTVTMLAVFSGMGLAVTSTKYVAEFRTRDPERAGRIIALGSAVAMVAGGLLALGMLFWAPMLAVKTLNAPMLVPELRIASIGVFFNALNGAQIGALAGVEAFRTIARVNLVRGILILPLTVSFVLLWRMPGAVWALAVTAAVVCVLSHLALERQCASFGIRPRFRSAWKERQVLWMFSIPAFLSGVLVAPVTWIANTMLVNQPGGFAEMGILSAANQWRTALLFLPNFFCQVTIPILASLQNVDGGRSARKVLISSMLASAVSTAPILVLLPCSGWIMSFYGAAFSTRASVLQISLLSAALLAIETPVGNLIVASGKVWAGFAMNAGWAVCLLVTAKALLSLGWGAQAVAVAYLVAYLVHAVWTFWFAASVLRISRQ